jgi:hypothetical protein
MPNKAGRAHAILLIDKYEVKILVAQIGTIVLPATEPRVPDRGANGADSEPVTREEQDPRVLCCGQHLWTRNRTESCVVQDSQTLPESLVLARLVSYRFEITRFTRAVSIIVDCTHHSRLNSAYSGSLPT